MITSARNTIYGTIESINKGAINSEVVLSIGNEKLAIILTNESVNSMECKVGEKAYALVKSSSIILAKEKPERISARNVLKMKVAEVKVGSINVEVTMNASENAITAQVTKESANKLEITTGDDIYAIFKASHIILGML
jgi:molybdate transport system regulatory protein